MNTRNVVQPSFPEMLLCHSNPADKPCTSAILANHGRNQLCASDSRWCWGKKGWWEVRFICGWDGGMGQSMNIGWELPTRRHFNHSVCTVGLSDLPQGLGENWLKIPQKVGKKRWNSIIQKAKKNGGFECQMTIQAQRLEIHKKGNE